MLHAALFEVKNIINYYILLLELLLLIIRDFLKFRTALLFSALPFTDLPFTALPALTSALTVGADTDFTSFDVIKHNVQYVRRMSIFSIMSEKMMSGHFDNSDIYYISGLSGPPLQNRAKSGNLKPKIGKKSGT
jgi:hypothetical protein